MRCVNCILNKTGHLHIICKMHIIMFKCRFLDQCTVKNTYIAREKQYLCTLGAE